MTVNTHLFFALLKRLGGIGNSTIQPLMFIRCKKLVWALFPPCLISPYLERGISFPRPLYGQLHGHILTSSGKGRWLCCKCPWWNVGHSHNRGCSCYFQDSWICLQRTLIRCTFGTPYENMLDMRFLQNKTYVTLNQLFVSFISN